MRFPAPIGPVIAVRGKAEPGGDFVVTGVCWPGLPQQPERQLQEQDAYVAFVSGLQLANSKADIMQVSAGMNLRSLIKVSIQLSVLING